MRKSMKNCVRGVRESLPKKLWELEQNWGWRLGNIVPKCSLIIFLLSPLNFTPRSSSWVIVRVVSTRESGKGGLWLVHVCVRSNKNWACSPWAHERHMKPIFILILRNSCSWSGGGLRVNIHSFHGERIAHETIFDWSTQGTCLEIRLGVIQVAIFSLSSPLFMEAPPWV